MNIFSHNYIFGVATCSKKPNGSLKLDQLLGTAFSIGNQFFVTANHVAESSKSSSLKGLIYYDQSDRASLFPIKDIEEFPDYDFAILEVPDIPHSHFNWNFNNLVMLDDVRSCGFPFAFDITNKVIRTRAFKGHVVSSGPHFRLPSHPPCYELSFQCPRGLSGAPLMTKDESSQSLLVKGIILGNNSTEMNIYTEKEIIKGTDGNIEKTYERFQAMELGVALNIDSIKDLNSRILKGTLYNYFNSLLQK